MSHFTYIEPEPNLPKRPDWRRAGRAIQIMRLDPGRTDQVFELNVALDGGHMERQFQGFLAEPRGADLLREAPELLDRLADFETLETLHPESLGRAYLFMMRAYGFDADGLRQEAAKNEEFAELHPGTARSWWSTRQSCVHDLLHVLTDYGQDPAGETALLAFTDGLFDRRLRLRVVRFGMFASIFSAPRASLSRAITFAWQARRRGVRSQIPLSFRWENALARPLAEVRRGLGIAPAEIAHPNGVLRGTMDEPWSLEPEQASAN